MLVFSEYQTGTIDLALSFYGYEDAHLITLLVQPFVIHTSYITLLKDKENFITRVKLLI